MILDKENLPNRFRLQEVSLDGGIVEYGIFADVGEYQKHDGLFEKYSNEPSGYGWEGLLVTYLEKENPNFIKRIKFDCNGDEFFCITNTENDQIKLSEYFLRLCNDTKLLEKLLSIVPNDRKG